MEFENRVLFPCYVAQERSPRFLNTVKNMAFSFSLQCRAYFRTIFVFTSFQVGDEYNVEQYYTLSHLACDPVKQVRSRFIAKLHKGLARGIPFKCLPLDFMGFYAMAGMELDKSIKDIAKRYMIADINARKDCIKNLTYSSGSYCHI